MMSEPQAREAVSALAPGASKRRGLCPPNSKLAHSPAEGFEDFLAELGFGGRRVRAECDRDQPRADVAGERVELRRIEGVEVVAHDDHERPELGDARRRL